MAYLAFYRTFRPSTFDEVVRQEHIVRILKNQINSGKVGHAYLFCGPRGTGKTTLAKIFARAVNCEHPRDGSPCGECAVCRALSSPANMDIVEIDAASNNGVDEMRDLREKVQYPPVAGRRKVYIIDEVHMLSPSAFNAVLKTLEEPPAHALFILATTEPQKIPATILSRCMRFDFKLIPREDLERLIKRVFDATGKSYDDEAVSAIARAGAGSARDSLSIADMCASYAPGRLTYDDVNAVLGAANFSSVAKIVNFMFEGDAPSALSAVEEVLSTGKGVGTLCKDILTFLNDVAIAKLCKNARDILSLPDDRFSLLYGSAERAEGHAVLRATEIIAACESDLKYALNGAITLETAVLKCAMPQADYNIDALIARVAALESEVNSLKAGMPRTLPSVVGGATPQPVAASAAAANEGAARREEKAAPAAKREAAEAKSRPALNAMDGADPFNDAPAPAENRAQASQPTLWEDAPAPANIGSLSKSQKDGTFANLLKLFRTTRRNAVLFTLCMDLDSAFEGDKFIMYTDTEAVYRALSREENSRTISEALADLGVFSHEVRLRPKGESKWESAERRLRENFKGIDIDIK